MRLRPMIGWGVFFFLISIVAQVLPSPRGTFYFFKGKQRFNSRDYEGAALAYRESVNADPNFARGYVELGSSYYALEKYAEAEEAFKQAMSIEEDSCASCGLGMTYRLEGRRDEAEAALRKSIQLNPRDTCPYDQLGRMYYDAKDYTKAIDAFRQEVKIKPNAVSYHFIANSIYNSSQVEESIEPYLEATRLDTNYENVFVDLGRAYHDLGRYKEAVGAFEHAIKLKPNDQKARAFLGVTQFILGNRQGAMEQYQWLLMKNPELAAELLKGFEELSPDVEKLERMRSGKR